jgi:hypothetical protein
MKDKDSPTRIHANARDRSQHFTFWLIREEVVREQRPRHAEQESGLRAVERLKLERAGAGVSALYGSGES